MPPPEASAMYPADLIISARWTIPVEPDGPVLDDHALVVRDGRILDLLPAAEAVQRYAPRELVRRPRHVLLPGLVNAHTHSPMTLFRGMADDLPLDTWLKEHIWPAEARWVDAGFVRDGTELAMLEMLQGGTTCFNDMYFFPEAAASAAREAGIRAVLGLTVLEFPTAYAADPGDYLAKGLASRDALRHEPLLSFCLAPHAPYTISDSTFERIATLANQLDLPVHIHIHETRAETEDSLRQHGVRPLARLQRAGLLGPGFIGVHGVQLDASEIDLLGEHRCHLAHCPTSNMKLANGAPPIAALQAHGVGVGLGSDGAASNNRLDLFHEMRHAALLAKAASEDATGLPAMTVLRMATLEGATALGLDAEIGSLLPGKSADLCAVRLDEWILQPCFDPASHLVYVAGREQVTHTWVAGRLRIRDGKPVDFDPRHLIELAKMWHTEICKH
jgi:5-methylthioadenosine/S-adenosylhomocysteine deaminase